MELAVRLIFSECCEGEVALMHAVMLIRARHAHARIVMWRFATLRTGGILKSVESGRSGGSLSSFFLSCIASGESSAARTTTTFCQWQADVI